MFIQIIPDRFNGPANGKFQNSDGSEKPGRPHIRRPTRGIVLKDETFASIRCVAGTGGSVKLVDAGSRRTDSTGKPLEINGKRATDVYSNFFLQSIQEERMEKQQVLETFGQAFIFLFGERARVITFSGILLNTFDFNWESEWWHNYENYLRGTKCVENDARIFLSYDETLIGGYILGCASQKTSQDRNFVNFTFQLFVTNYTSFSDVGNPYALPGITKPVTRTLTSSESFFLPRRMPAMEDEIRDFKVDGSEGEESIFDAIGDAVAAVKDVWQQALQMANFAFQYSSNLVNGEVVRIPMGFAGSMVFDEEINIKVHDVEPFGTVKYSTFDQNDDEYIGFGDHYGSAVSASGVIQHIELSEVTFEDELNSSKTMAKKAQAIWDDAGMFVMDNQLNPVAAAMVGVGVGLVLSAFTASVQEATADPPVLVEDETGVHYEGSPAGIGGASSGMVAGAAAARAI